MSPIHLRRKRASDPARPFVVSLLLVSTLAALTLTFRGGADSADQAAGSLTRRDFLNPLVAADDAPWTGDEICHHVHRYHVKDQCAFVKTNCPDEEAGLFSYLTLYYCHLAHVKPIGFLIIAIWTSFLFTTIGVAASDFFCINLSTISNYLGMSESMAGVTFLAFGNGSPDVFSTFAAVKSHSGSLAVGELIGAAGFITAVVAGSMAIIRPFHVYKKSFIRDIGFFIVAVVFTMVFLANGSLTVWECVVMVAFYVFYVLFVVAFHWFINRSRRRRERSAAARAHFVLPESPEVESMEEYRDDDAGDATRRSGSRPVSFRDLDESETVGYDDEAGEDLDDDDEETRDKWMGELTSNMRVAKRPDRNRTTPITPIRPSLVGALEFQAVLASLEKSRHQHTASLNLRRYSDTPYYTTAQQQQTASRVSDPAGAEGAYETCIRDFENANGTANNSTSAMTGTHGRSNSANNASALDRARRDFSKPMPSFNLTSVMPPRSDPNGDHDVADALGRIEHFAKTSPIVSVTSPEDEYFTHGPRQPIGTTDLLAPPEAMGLHRTVSSDNTSHIRRPSRPRVAIPTSPRIGPRPSPMHSPLLTPLSNRSGSRSPTLIFPELTIADSVFDNDAHSRVLSWWPYRYLPSPAEIARTIFPTLYGWRKKSLWSKTLGVLSAPSFFFLAITLPVVEASTEESAKPAALLVESSRASGPATKTTAFPAPRSTATVASSTEERHRHASGHSAAAEAPEAVAEHVSLPVNHEHGWNRWLVLLQCITAPWFVVVIFWANGAGDLQQLLRPTLYCLLGSLVAISLVLLTTSATRTPAWHFLLCFVGFAVSITWISTIANEVVGVLKTIGVIFNMSDAILGLTIFAVGNSLGDLVADVTVARLGFPVMAYSATLGGPMLNILLGIGLSGLYMTINGAEKRSHKHPDRPLKFRPYHVQVSTTLLISAAALLVTLLGLLIAVPLNGWKMDRKIGWGLITLWILATIGNVAVEISGIGEDYTIS